jgi:hypothetical protein
MENLIYFNLASKGRLNRAIILFVTTRNITAYVMYNVVQQPPKISNGLENLVVVHTGYHNVLSATISFYLRTDFIRLAIASVRKHAEAVFQRVRTTVFSKPLVIDGSVVPRCIPCSVISNTGKIGYLQFLTCD